MQYYSIELLMPELKSLGKVSKEQANLIIQEKISSKPKVESAPVVTTPVVEKPVEQPQRPIEEPNPVAPVDAKKEESSGEQKPVEQPKKKSLRDFVKPVSKETPKETKSEELPEIFKSQLSEKEKRIAELEAIVNDPDNQIWFETRKSGKEVFDILREVDGINPETLSNEQLREIQLKQDGIEGDDFEEAMDDFRSMKSYEQRTLVKPIKEKLKQDGSLKKQEFMSKLSQHNQQSTQEQAHAQELLRSSQTQALNFGKSLIGKNHMGVQVTPEMVKSVENSILKDGLLDTNPDGSLNSEQLFNLAFLKKFFLDTDLIITAIENYAGSEVAQSIEEKVGVTGSEAKTNRAPVVAPLTDEETRKHIVQTIRPVQNQYGNPSVRV